MGRSQTISLRATVDGSILGAGETLQEKLTDAEIDEMKRLMVLLNDFNKHTNIQSGVDPNRLWTTKSFSYLGVTEVPSFSLSNGHLPNLH